MNSCGYHLEESDAPCPETRNLDPKNGRCGRHGGQVDAESGKWICGAQKRGKPGQFCQVAKGLDPDSHRCRLHGGMTPKGAASPHFKHGRSSRVWQAMLPKELARDVKRALADPELLNLEHEAALSDGQLAAIVRQINQAGGVPDWSIIRAAYDKTCGAVIGFADLVPQGEEKIDAARASVTDALQAFGSIIQNGINTERARKEIRTETNHKRRLVATESRRRQDLRLNIPAVNAYALIDTIVEIIMRHVENSHIREAIGRDIGNILDSSRGGEASTNIPDISQSIQ